MRNILLLLFVSLFLFGCPIDNRIGAKFTEKKVIKNRSDYETRITLYSFSDIFLDVTIVAGDSVVSSAYCEVTGSQKGCTEIEGNYNNLLFEELADSMHIIFDDEKIFRYVRQEIGSCAGEDVLLSSTFMRIY